MKKILLTLRIAVSKLPARAQRRHTVQFLRASDSPCTVSNLQIFGSMVCSQSSLNYIHRNHFPSGVIA